MMRIASFAARCLGGPQDAGRAPPRSYPARGQIDHAQAEHQRGQGALQEAAQAPLPSHRLPGVQQCRLQEVQPDSHPRRLASLWWKTKCLKKARSPMRPTAVGAATAKAEAASGKRENPTPSPRPPATSSRMCSTHAITLSHHPLSDTFDGRSDQRTILATKYEDRQLFAPH